MNSNKRDFKKSIRYQLKTAKSQKRTKKIDQNRTKRSYEIFKNRKPLEYLNKICLDSGLCIAFGIETKRIHRFFSGFNTFEYVDSMKKIGSESMNGDVFQLNYEKEGYIANAVLKITKPTNNNTLDIPDNLVYEYMVGKFINKQNIIYPCFLETYEVYDVTNISINKKEDFKRLVSSKEEYKISNNNNQSPQEDKDVFPILLKHVCDNNPSIALLIQHISGAKTLLDHINKDSNFIENEMLCILFQLYFALSEIKDKFTHYDFHLENVLLYEPVKNHYIQFHYYYNNQKISFKSRYIAKIIDYGRCFFKDQLYSSKDIYNYICKLKNCDCGKKIGFIWLSDIPGYRMINSCQQKNISHDLRLLHLLKNYVVDEMDIIEIIDMVLYGEGLADALKNYGTKENLKSGLSNNQILNVDDAFEVILSKMKTPENMEKNTNLYKKDRELGQLFIYGKNKPMIFQKN